MLVLTRKIGQQVLIDKASIQVKVLRVDDGIITLGFNAPSHIDIDREEIFVKKVMQKQELTAANDA